MDARGRTGNDPHAAFSNHAFGSPLGPPPSDSARTSSVMEFEIMDRAQLIDMRQHGTDALGLGLEARKAQQRIEPDQLAAGAMDAMDLECETVIRVALETIGDEQNDGTLRKDAPRPQLVERVQ